MASQSSSRMRRIASPSTKQGPMKATLTFGLKGNPATAKSCSGPSSSPTLQRAITDSHRKTRRSPDNRASPDRNSPSSPCFKVEKNKNLFPPSIKRTNSLDTIASNWYLKSEWPGLTSEKATQTEEDWEVSTDRRKRVSHKRSSSLGNGDNSKEKFKARLAKTTKEGSRASVVVAPRAVTLPASHLAVISNPVTVTTLHRSKALPMPHIPKPAARVIGSIEGLNQEIEKLVLSTTSATGGEEIGSTRTQEPTPDGHRAPILELLQGGSTSGSSSSTRTVVTQTPSGSNSGATSGGGDIICVSDMKTMLIQVTVDNSGSNSSSRSQSESPSYSIIPGQMDNSRPSSSRSESLDSKEDRAEKDCDSLLFVREPPDGCDKVIVEEPRMALECESFVFCPIKKPEKCRIPSNESAFSICPLYDKYLTQSTEMALKAASPGGKPGISPPALETQ